MRAKHPSDEKLTRALLLAGVAVGPLTGAVFTAEGRRRRDYSPRRHPISALALGPRGWVQTANFLVSGPLTLAAAVGLRRSQSTGPSSAVVPWAVAAAGAGLIGAGIFPTDPVPGYPDPEGTDATRLRLRSVGGGLNPNVAGPAGVPDRPLTRTGSLHVLSAVPFFVGMPAAALAGAVRAWKEDRRGMAALLGGVALVGMAGSSAAGRGFSGKGRLSETGGRWQRVSVAAGFGGLGALSLSALGTAREG